MGQALKVCENCEFRVEQVNIDGNLENMCILTNKHIGLFCACSRYKLKTGDHITQLQN